MEKHIIGELRGVFGNLPGEFARATKWDEALVSAAFEHADAILNDDIQDPEPPIDVVEYARTLFAWRDSTLKNVRHAIKPEPTNKPALWLSLLASKFNGEKIRFPPPRFLDPMLWRH
jgi:hypothetical protein